MIYPSKTGIFHNCVSLPRGYWFKKRFYPVFAGQHPHVIKNAKRRPTFIRFIDFTSMIFFYLLNGSYILNIRELPTRNPGSLFAQQPSVTRNAQNQHHSTSINIRQHPQQLRKGFTTLSFQVALPLAPGIVISIENLGPQARCHAVLNPVGNQQFLQYDVT